MNDNVVNSSDISFDPCDGSEIKGKYFTSTDVVGLMEYFKKDNSYSVAGMIQYFNARYKCNRIVNLLKGVIKDGLKLLPDVYFAPVTMKFDVVGGKFQMVDTPYFMRGSYFVSNLAVLKLNNKDGNMSTNYAFYDDIEINLNTLICDLKDDVDGTVSVTYFVSKNDTIGGESLNN